MKFEEQFPSLKDKGLSHDIDDIEAKYGPKLTEELMLYEGVISVGTKMLQEHCLDKQTVKEAINIELSKARLLIKEHERNSALIEYFKGQIDMCIILLKRLED